MRKKSFSFSLFVFVLTMIFFYTPIIILFVFSFNSSKTMNWQGFSLVWYKKLFTDSADIWRSFGNSIIVALSSSAVATFIGTLGAIGIRWYKFRSKRFIEIISYLPLVLPDIIIGVSLLIMFSLVKIKLSLFTIFLAHATFNIPYVLFIVLSRLDEFDSTILEAAKDLGASEIQTLLKVIIPISVPGIIAGFLMSMTLSLDDFVITFFVSGPGSSTLPLHIYSMIRFGVSPVINAISAVMIIGTILLAVLTRRFYKYMF
ncbi:MAG TPA: ABC transporter permease [Tepiditoga sp.]|nr:ABC transporter permease [Tepiditoga sp.]